LDVAVELDTTATRKNQRRRHMFGAGDAQHEVNQLVSRQRHDKRRERERNDPRVHSHATAFDQPNATKIR